MTHGNLLAAARLVAASLELRPDDVSLNVMPLSHVHGLVSVALATLASGGTLVLPQAFHPLAFWRIARDHGVTWYSAAPSVHQWLLARTADPGARKPAGAARLRFIRSAGATLPPAVRRTLESAFGAPVIDAYEVTEAAGEALAGHVTILDTSGVPVPAGVRGEIAVSGPTVAAGYDNAPDLTHKFFVGGRFHTGDLGYRDPHGRLTLVTEGE